MKILIVDDEKHIRESIQRLLQLEGIDSDTAASGEDGAELLLEESFNAVILDLRLPGMNGQEFLEWMQERSIRTPVIMISAHGEIRDAVAALKAGAKDYLVKPFEPEELLLKLKNMVESSRRADLIELGRRTSSSDSGLIGESTGMKQIRKQIAKIASSRSTVLLTGESGSGKEVVAREIHRLSPARDEPFVAVNTGSIPETLMESELFGHEKGAFTGADALKPGLFELAGKGCIFLDEIGETPLPLQVKLLRVLQEKKTRRLGGTRDIPAEARVIAATNRDIDSLVSEGKFREDLYYRLNVIRITVPPLRERISDIPLLAGYLLSKLKQSMGFPDISLHPAALEKLMSYHFPGNVRELENVLERAIIYRDGSEILAEDIETRPGRATSFPGAETHHLPRTGQTTGKITPSLKGGSLEMRERRAIAEALQKFDGNRTKAAEELGISRRTILYKIKRYGL